MAFQLSQNEKYLKYNQLKRYAEGVKKYIDDKDKNLTETLDNEIEQRKQSEANLENLIDTNTTLDGSSIIRKDGKITLNSSYVKYLDSVIYDQTKPNIKIFDFKDDIKNSYEIGTEVIINGFKHQEENIFNFESTLTLNKEDVVIESDVLKNEFISTIEYSETINSDTTYSLNLTIFKPDSTTETISKSLNISFYAPAFIITSTQSTLSADQIIGNDNLNIINRYKKDSSTLKGTQSIYLNDNGYIYFITTDNINKIIDFDTQFAFENTQLSSLEIPINGVPKIYKIYRSAQLISGNYNVVIS